MNLVITPTLLDAFDWYLTCPEDWRARAKEELIAKITRKPFEASEAALKGIKLETAVQEICESAESIDALKATAPFKRLCKLCKGGQFQTWQETFFEHENQPVRAYGKVDVLFDDRVIDIKTTGKYGGKNKYLAGWQPTVYLLATKRPIFEFLVAIWEAEAALKVRELRVISLCVTPPQLLQMRQKLIDRYAEFTAWLKKEGLYDEYLYTFCKNKKAGE